MGSLGNGKWGPQMRPVNQRRVAMNRTAKRAFTLVEILIVVIILGILAAIVIPQFTQASTEARVSNLRTNLQTIRGQLQLYKTQHNDIVPTTLSTQLVQFSDISGGVSATSDSTHTFGPYLQSIPVNPLSNSNAIRVVTGASTAFAAPTADAGWWFNSTTGEFRADLKDSWVTTDATKYNSF
jgi:general secretion pathway protein G